MATGPEHYQEAERLAGDRGEWYYVDADEVPAILARAQVHATLALAAAVAGLDVIDGPGGVHTTGRDAVDSIEWQQTLWPRDKATAEPVNTEPPDPFAGHRGTCDSCSAPIIWAKTTNNNRMPVDAEPVDDGSGNLVLQHGSLGRGPLARVVDTSGVRYRSHFATCPNAAQHRRPR